ncbi:YqjK-like protein [Methylovorus glucosotrophus]|nr:YqjK-like protein [Methylovorus glucosotrophus]
MQALARRRAQLLQQSAQQRTLIALHAEVWQARLARLDHSLTVLKFMRSHAVFLGPGVWLLLRWQRNPTRHWYYQMFKLWRYYQQWRALRSPAPASTDMDNRPAEMHTPFVINPP